MKKILVSFLAVLVVAFAFSAKAPADEFTLTMHVGSPYMTVNDTDKEIDAGRGTAPVIKNGRTLVPVRAIVEEMGGKVSWNEKKREIGLEKGGKTILLKIGSTDGYIDGERNVLDTAPEVINDRTMLPIRFVAEGFGYNVLWNDDTRGIIITDKIQLDSGRLRVHFIDVGQGDAIFAELPNGETMLIDAGPEDGTAARYISGLGYSKITYVIATHPDADHITGMPRILSEFGVKKFYMPNKEHTTKIFDKMLDALQQNGCEAIYAAAGKTVFESGTLAAQFVAPQTIYSDNNNFSAVLRVSYKNISFLFEGDAEAESEQDMLRSGCKLKSDILKVSHHGSTSSTTAAFLDAVSPSAAVISVGDGNRYSHPSDKILKRLSDRGILVYRTDESGTVIAETDGKGYTIKSSR